MTEAMPFLRKYDITFLRPPTILSGRFHCKTNFTSDFFPAPAAAKILVRFIRTVDILRRER